MRFHSAFSLACMAVFAGTQPLPAQWSPFPTAVGMKLTFSRSALGFFYDSVLYAGPDRLIVLRSDMSAPIRETIRQFEHSPQGILLSDSLGGHLLAAANWPQQRQWSYSRQGATFRYAILGDTAWAMWGSPYRATIVQLTVEQGEAKSIQLYYIVDGLGYVQRVSLPEAQPDDYKLVAIKPAQVIASTMLREESPVPASQPPYYPASPPTRPPRSIPKWVPRPFVGLVGLGGTVGLRRKAAGQRLVTDGFYGSAGEVGLEGPIGIRGRYGVFEEAATDQGMGSKTEFATAEVVFTSRSTDGTVAIWVAGGPAWLRPYRGSDPRPQTTTDYSLGLRLGGRHLSISLEASYLADHVPQTLRYDPNSLAVSDPRRAVRIAAEGDGAFVLLSLRLQ